MLTQIAEITINSSNGFDNHDFYVEGELIAKIEYDHSETETQPWKVVVNGQCLTSFNAYAGVEAYIFRNYKQKTLPKWTVDRESEPGLEVSFYPIKCVLQQRQYVTIEGNSYSCGVKTRQIEIVVSSLTENAVQIMLDSLGLSEWELVDWWRVQIFALEPNF